LFGKKFPFLIGTVRTAEVFEKKLKKTRFPFLIGTVRTLTLLISFPLSEYVSIPHRYGKNQLKLAPYNPRFMRFHSS